MLWLLIQPIAGQTVGSSPPYSKLTASTRRCEACNQAEAVEMVREHLDRENDRIARSSTSPNESAHFALLPPPEEHQSTIGLNLCAVLHEVVACDFLHEHPAFPEFDRSKRPVLPACDEHASLLIINAGIDPDWYSAAKSDWRNGDLPKAPALGNSSPFIWLPIFDSRIRVLVKWSFWLCRTRAPQADARSPDDNPWDHSFE